LEERDKYQLNFHQHTIMISRVMYDNQCRVSNKYNGLSASGSLGAGRGVKLENIDGTGNFKPSVLEMRHLTTVHMETALHCG
jgi:hypothetical protein